MSKKKDGNKAKTKLEKARDRLAELEEAYARTQIKGEKRIREAQEKSEKAIARARERLEAQREIVARREGTVATVAPAALAEEIHSPEEAADRVATAEANGSTGDGQGSGDTIILPEGLEPSTGEIQDPFRD